MLLRELTGDLQGIRLRGSADLNVTSIVYDSRKATPGSLFVAVRGENFDGRQFIPAALANGAVAVVSEQEIPELSSDDVSVVITPDTRGAMGALSAKFFGYPSRKLNLVGVTGTKGKTTTTHLISSIFRAAGQKTGIIGTLGSRIEDQVIETEHTTPESVDLQAVLAQMVEAGAQTVAMEVSSHGLVQRRVAGCEFDCGVFTNLTREHLDYHKTMDDYLAAKLLLFEDYAVASSKQFVALVNMDDSVASRVIRASQGRVLTYSANGQADMTASDVKAFATSLSYTLTYNGQNARVELPLGGLFNVYNSLAAASVALAQGLPLAVVAEGLSKAPNVPGRFESVDCGQDFTVLVDYAHAPDALENVLKSARELTQSKLIVVFGCGGNRDRGKRPIMGRIACDLADKCVITSDNPRKEDPEAIIAEILTGVVDEANVITITDRREAIRAAVSMAEDGDLVVVAGKGHEDYQIFGETKIHFDDREVVREILCEDNGR